mmetsp:Transcript_7553/g.9625  ORF Transcript_7553/g.9625 Transcript_7553/m.9625 type:complete len:85 (+) Transcript_7553:1355-1609(+)
MLCYACNFSQRNGFGPVPSIPGQIAHDNNNISIARELRSLLSFSAVEVAAIRQILPLISVLRLSHGNVGSKGCMAEIETKYNIS